MACCAPFRALVGAAALSVGCAHWFSQVAGDSVDASIAAATRPDNVTRLAGVFRDPAMLSAVEGAARVIADTSLDALGAGPSDQRLREASAALSEGMRPTIRAFVAEDLRATAESTVDHAVDRLVRELADARRRGVFQATAVGVADAVARTTVEVLREAIGDGPAAGIGAALAGSLELEILPSIGRAMDGVGDGDLRPILGATTRSITEQAMLGLADAVRGDLGDAIEARVAAREAAIQDAVDAWIRRTEALAALAFALFLAAVAIGIWGWRRKGEAEARAEAMALMAKAWQGGLGIEHIGALGKGTAAGDALESLLRDRPPS